MLGGSLGTGLLWGPTGAVFLISEVPLYNLNPPPWKGGHVAIPGACWVYRRTSLMTYPPPLGSPQVPRHRATVGSYGGGVSYERGTPVYPEPPTLDRRACRDSGRMLGGSTALCIFYYY